MQKRLDFLDMTKFLAVFLMVICHTSVPHTFDSIVHAFHMPVFFMVSGWCFNQAKNTKAVPFVKKRIRSLIIPYFFWAAVLFLMWQIFFLCFDKTRVYPLDKFAYYLFYSNAEYSPFCTVQWFLTAMFFAAVISFFVITAFKKSKAMLYVSTVLLAIVGVALPYVLPVRLPLAVDVALSSSAFFMVGWLIPNLIAPRLSKRLKAAALSPVTLVLLLGVGITEAYFNGYVNLRIMQFNNQILFYLSAVTLSLAVILISYYLCRLPERIIRIPLFYGRNSLQILIFNQLFIQIIKLFKPDFSYTVWFLCAVGVMLLMYPVILFTNRYLPFTLGKTKKKA